MLRKGKAPWLGSVGVQRAWRNCTCLWAGSWVGMRGNIDLSECLPADSTVVTKRHFYVPCFSSSASAVWVWSCGALARQSSYQHKPFYMWCSFWQAIYWVLV